ncbi:MAG TPA: hypothetical protein VH601_11685 [Bryobacteraceae bacterium]|jgi:hypothetical protein
MAAIATTKIVMLPNVGFWAVARDARTDYFTLMGLLFVLASGARPLSFDSIINCTLSTSHTRGR